MMSILVKPEHNEEHFGERSHPPSWRRIDRKSDAINDERANELTISHQLIVDRQNKTIGCELRLNGGSSFAQAGLPVFADASVLARATVGEFGSFDAHKVRKTFIRATPALLESPEIDLWPTRALVLELDFSGVPDDAMLNRCRQLHDRGFSLALTNYTGIDDRSRPLLSILDIVEISLNDCDEQTCQELAGSLSSLPIKLLAQGVDTAGQMAFCRRVGFHLFQGEHIARPEAMGRRWLPVSRAGLLRLIDLVDSHAGIDIIEDAIKKEAALIYNLLHLPRIVDSAQATTHGTLRGILTLLGGNALRRWLQFQLMTLDGGQVHNSCSYLVMQVASLRGRMLELLMQKLELHDNRLLDSAYLTGCLSMMPTALHETMDGMLQCMTVEPDVARALLSRDGFLGQSLEVLETFDKRDSHNREQQLARQSGGILNYADLNDCFAGALAWLTETDV